MGISEKTVTIEELIPQRQPMILVDTFDGIDAEGVSHTSFTVSEGNLFLEKNRLTECGLIEHMAQSAAARTGWECRQNGSEIPIGYIGAVSRFAAGRLPAVGTQLHTSLRIVQQLGNLSLAAVRIEAGNETIARGELKIYLNA